jgi:two-component system sensor histidine kinase QseC
MQSSGFSIVNYNNDEWRIYTLPITGKSAFIEVGEKLDLRDTLVANILFNLALPLLLLVPVVGVLIWVGIGSGLGTIRNLVEQIRKRSPDDLSHVDIETLPKDLIPLGKSLNQLFTKLEHSFTAEKRFADHAAHQLRTPLATLKLQLQMLAEAKNEDERKQLIQELIRSNERAAKLVGTLLTSARLSHQPVILQSVPLYPVLATVMAELGLLATQKNIEISLDGEEKSCAWADEMLLKLLLHNIVENAIKYTPAGGEVRVKIAPCAAGYKILVRDTGCGIPEAQRGLVFERFYRIDTPMEEGSGLGLAIAAEIVKRFSGDISLKNPENNIGLLVEVILPKYNKLETA